MQLSKQAHIQLKWEANYWKAQHRRALARIAELEKEIERLEAKNCDLQQRLFGRRSEKSGAKSEPLQPPVSGPKRQRGQQPNSPGHGRSDRSLLPVVVTEQDIAEEAKRCSICGAVHRRLPLTEESEIIEVEVRAHRRRIRRAVYRRGCQCEGQGELIIAPPAPRVYPKATLGVSVWTEVLLDKYLYLRPTYRLCQALADRGFELSPGTLTDGLRRLEPLFEPLLAALHEKQLTEPHMHGDETRWEVFEAIEGKVGHRWYLWVFRSASVVFYRLEPTRGARVPKAHLAELRVEALIFSCDRYSAYKCLANAIHVIILAFCWAHVRRDFLQLARGYPTLTDWALGWVEAIARLYHLNGQRLQHWDRDHALDAQSPPYQIHQRALEAQLSVMTERRERDLASETLHPAAGKVLTSLGEHWPGLIVFAAHPEVPMDNNPGERSLRLPVTGRKNFYGSGSLWSARLAAGVLTVLQTIRLWGLNPHHWLYAWLQACADSGGQSPSDLSPFLPWQMDEARRGELSQPLPGSQPRASPTTSFHDTS
ncbi:MAG TPA: IS66 family transposase [Acidobacteriota bacterium]|nr:IS66 family transposase [Acidobacteriota bacterium]